MNIPALYVAWDEGVHKLIESDYAIVVQFACWDF